MEQGTALREGDATGYITERPRQHDGSSVRPHLGASPCLLSARSPGALPHGPRSSRSPHSASDSSPLPTSKQLAGARVQIPELSLVTPADREGRFDLDAVPAGGYRLIVAYIGFR